MMLIKLSFNYTSVLLSPFFCSTHIYLSLIIFAELLLCFFFCLLLFGGCCFQSFCSAFFCLLLFWVRCFQSFCSDLIWLLLFGVRRFQSFCSLFYTISRLAFVFLHIIGYNLLSHGSKTTPSEIGAPTSIVYCAAA